MRRAEHQKLEYEVFRRWDNKAPSHSLPPDLLDHHQEFILALRTRKLGSVFVALLGP